MRAACRLASIGRSCSRPIMSARSASLACIAACVCAQVVAFEPSSTTPPIIAASAAMSQSRHEIDQPHEYQADPQRSGGDGNLGGQRNLAAALDRLGQFLDARLDAGDVVVGNVVAGRPHRMTPHPGFLLLKYGSTLPLSLMVSGLP